MMDAGHARREANDHERALAQFQGADAIMHVPTTGLEVAREQAALGLLNEARDTVRRVLRIPALRIGVGGTMPDVPIHVTVDGTDIPVPALIAPFKVNPAVAGVGVALGVASFFVRGSTTSARGTAVARPRLTTWIGAAGSGFGGTF